MVFQNYALYAHMTVYENMAFSLMMRKVHADEIHEKVMSAAEVLGLTEQLGRKPRQLSGGQRQRVAVGRAMVRNPKVFLFDEPLSNLDAKLRGSMRRELKMLHRRLGATTIYVTHDQIEALTLADRIVVMNDGKIQQIGKPAELYNSPANVFVASFIGLPPMNFLDAEAGKDTLEISGIKFAMPQDADINAKTVVVGVRPEDIMPAQDGMPLRVVINENLGQSTLVHGMLGGKRVTAKFRKWYDYKRGDIVNVAFAQNKTHVFDKKTGASLTRSGRGTA
jgi:multiple sugar transport system ATP-binding protein